MSVDLYSGFYPRKCIDPEILPLLNLKGTDEIVFKGCRALSGMDDVNAKWLPKNFFDKCREFAIHDKENDCYIFDDKEKLFKFAEEFSNCGVNLADQMYYIVEGYSEKAPIYIIWCR
jgi:hypothetical protein